MTKGRPTLYRPEHADQARRAYERGTCDEDVAEELNIGTATLYRWRRKYPDFAAATAIGKAQADDRVERALYQRAIGFEYRAERAFLAAGTAKPVIVRYTKRVLANPHAALRWLRIRRPEEWREREVKEPSGSFVERFQKAMRRVAEGRARDAEER
jgi:hypothetical protein